MIRKDFLMMDDRLWTPEEWAAWLKCLGYKAAVFGEKDSPFITKAPGVKNNPKP